jgi:hypothetical protein
MLIGFYLGNSAVASSFGAAGSLALLLIWIYYSAQILFFGAEFTQVYTNNYGSKIIPEEGTEAAVLGTSPQPQRKPARKFQPQHPIPVTGSLPQRGMDLEKQNQQTARVFVGLMAVSFFTGILTTILGLRRK